MNPLVVGESVSPMTKKKWQKYLLTVNFHRKEIGGNSHAEIKPLW